MAVYPGFMTQAQIDAEAQARAQAAQAAERQSIQEQMDAAAAANARSGQDIQGFSNALAGVLGQIAPQIQGIYGGAARDQATFGKGFSDGLKLWSAQNASQVNPLLQNIGAPEGQMLKPTGASADVAYGLGGYFPASALGREGAGFASAASFLPATAQLRGQQDYMTNILQGKRERAEFERHLSKLDTEYPGLLQHIVDSLNADQLARFATKIQQDFLERKFGLQAANYFTDAQGRTVPKGYHYDANGNLTKNASAGKPTANNNRTLAWDDFNNNIDTAASGFFKDVTNEFTGAVTSKPTKTRTQAFNVLWNKYGKRLVRLGANPPKVRAAINQALTQAGYPRPLTKKQKQQQRAANAGFEVIGGILGGGR